MIGTKYLGEILQSGGYNVERDRREQRNTMIISPTGSGKTYYILNQLCKGKKCLYLCDTTNLKEAILKEPNTIEYGIYSHDKIEVTTYSKFGMECRLTKDEFINRYDYIICDEIHNLIDYQRFTNGANLAIALEYLIRNYDHTKIFFFTATPYYLQCMKEQYPNFLSNFRIINIDPKEVPVKHYINKRLAYISNIEQIRYELYEYREGFSDGGLKCLIFTNKIEDMQRIENMCIDNNLRPICIWSPNAEQRMNDEQVLTKQYLIKTGYLKEPYNALIINRATETGVNIYDPKMELVIVNASNITQQIQVRGRVRHDVDLLVVKTKDIEQTVSKFHVPKEYLNTLLSKQDIEELIKDYGFRNIDGTFITANKFLTLIKDKHKVTKKRKVKDGKQTTMYIIEKKIIKQ